MLRALLAAGVTPDLVLGTSIGALNGVVVAADPSLAAVERLAELWGSAAAEVFSSGLVSQLVTLARTRTHLHSAEPLRRLLAEVVGQRRIEDLPVEFGCVAASVERAAEHWFESGPVADAVLASCAVPGLLPPVEVDGEHFLDGGLVNSIPVGRALRRGATEVFVLHVGRLEHPLTAPRWPWEVGLVAFEVARRHRFATDMARLPEDVTVHVLPTGGDVPRYNDLAALRYRAGSRVSGRIDRAHAATADYLRAAGLERAGVRR